MIAGSCSSSYAPSINVGDNRMAISANTASTKLTESDDTGSTSFTPAYSSDIDIALGRVIAKNLELGVILSSNSYTYDFVDSIGGSFKSSTKSTSIGIYGKYYLFAQAIGAGGMVPWVQGAVLIGEYGNDVANNDAPGAPTITTDADLFTTAISVGATHFLSENAAVEYALTKRFIDTTDFASSTDPSPFLSGHAAEEDATYFTVGFSIIF